MKRKQDGTSPPNERKEKNIQHLGSWDHILGAKNWLTKHKPKDTMEGAM